MTIIELVRAAHKATGSLDLDPIVTWILRETPYVPNKIIEVARALGTVIGGPDCASNYKLVRRVNVTRPKPGSAHTVGQTNHTGLRAAARQKKPGWYNRGADRCKRCGAPVVPQTTMCQKHLTQNREAQRRYQRNRRGPKPAYMEGLLRTDFSNYCDGYHCFKAEKEAHNAND